MPHTTHGKNIKKKEIARRKLRRNIARELHCRKWDLTPGKIFQRLLQRKQNETDERARRKQLQEEIDTKERLKKDAIRKHFEDK